MTLLSNAEGRALLAQHSKKGKKPPPVAQVQRNDLGANTEKPAPAALPEEPKKPRVYATPEQKRDAVPRPRFALTEHEQYGGFRFVAHSINEAQAEALCKAAEAAGIQQQN